jgi:hypothetical protein
MLRILGVDDADRVFVSLAAVVVGMCAALALGFGVAVLFVDRTPVASDPGRARVGVSADCSEAVQRAEAVLGEARGLDDALGRHTVVVDDLMAGRITPQQAVQQMLPALTAGSRHSAAMDLAAKRFEEVARRCRR